MGLVAVIEGIVLGTDYPQGRNTTHFWDVVPGNPGGNSRVVLSRFPVMAYETAAGGRVR